VHIERSATQSRRSGVLLKEMALHPSPCRRAAIAIESRSLARYRRHTTEWWDGIPFDGVVSSMALMDIDDLAGATAATTVRPGGWFAWSINHPAFPGIEHVLHHPARGRLRARTHRRTAVAALSGPSSPAVLSDHGLTKSLARTRVGVPTAGPWTFFGDSQGGCCSPATSGTPLPEVARPAMSTGRSTPAASSGRAPPAIGPGSRS